MKTMDLKCKLPHKKNTLVVVNGTRYQIDNDLYARGVKADDAKKLLKAGSEWELPKGEVSKAPVPKPEAPEQSPQPSAEPKATQDASEKASEESGETSSEEVTGENGEDPEEWPDPKMNMSKEYLQRMAKAYGVEFEENTTKKDLIAMIMVEMYPEK